MLKKLDNRSVCFEKKKKKKKKKKSKIKQTKMQTALRRAGQVVKVFECKIVEKRLNAKQREELLWETALCGIDAHLIDVKFESSALAFPGKHCFYFPGT